MHASLLPQAPAEILERKKQPYRAPDALSFAAPEAAEWLDGVADTASLAEAGVFAPGAARQVLDKCRDRAGSGQFSNADNMAVVGIVSTQLLHRQFVTDPRTSPPLDEGDDVKIVAGERSS